MLLVFEAAKPHLQVQVSYSFRHANAIDIKLERRERGKGSSAYGVLTLNAVLGKI